MQDKILINDNFTDSLSKIRKKILRKSANEVSELCGKGRFWLNNIENRKVSRISRADALTLLQVILEVTPEEAEHILQCYLDDNDYDFNLAIKSESVNSNNRSTVSCPQINRRNAQRQSLRDDIKSIERSLSKIVLELDYDDPKSVLKYGAPIHTLERILSTDSRYIFDLLFGFPLQNLGQEGIQKIASILKEGIATEYYTDGLEEPQLKLRTKEDFEKSILSSICK